RSRDDLISTVLKRFDLGAKQNEIGDRSESAGLGQNRNKTSCLGREKRGTETKRSKSSQNKSKAKENKTKGERKVMIREELSTSKIVKG
ncbi:hypothetical protein V1478_011046, partial [Vespula squamosa]